MAKTYNTIPSVATGDVYTASAHNAIGTTINSMRVPPSCMVRRTTNLTGYSSNAAITWESTAWDTDPTMWTAGDATKISFGTTGLYLATLVGYFGATATVTTASANLAVDGTTVASSYSSISGGTNGYFSLAAILDITAGSYLTAFLGFIGGSAYIVGGAASLGNQQTRMQVAWLGQKA